jgi:hypothetical protein
MHSWNFLNYTFRSQNEYENYLKGDLKNWFDFRRLDTQRNTQHSLRHAAIVATDIVAALQKQSLSLQTPHPSAAEGDRFHGCIDARAVRNVFYGPFTF